MATTPSMVATGVPARMDASALIGAVYVVAVYRNLWSSDANEAGIPELGAGEWWQPSDLLPKDRAKTSIDDWLVI
jgi:hypothetical protein